MSYEGPAARKPGLELRGYEVKSWMNAGMISSHRQGRQDTEQEQEEL